MVRSISTFLIISDLSSNLDKGALSFEIEGQASRPSVGASGRWKSALSMRSHERKSAVTWD